MFIVCKETQVKLPLNFGENIIGRYQIILLCKLPAKSNANLSRQIFIINVKEKTQIEIKSLVKQDLQINSSDRQITIPTTEYVELNDYETIIIPNLSYEFFVVCDQNDEDYDDVSIIASDDSRAKVEESDRSLSMESSYIGSQHDDLQASLSNASKPSSSEAPPNLILKSNKKKVLTKKPPPTKRITPYGLYASENRNLLASEYPSKSKQEITKQLSADWKDLESDLKKAYKDRADDHNLLVKKVKKKADSSDEEETSSDDQKTKRTKLGKNIEESESEAESTASSSIDDSPVVQRKRKQAIDPESSETDNENPIVQRKRNPVSPVVSSDNSTSKMEVVADSSSDTDMG